MGRVEEIEGVAYDGSAPATKNHRAQPLTVAQGEDFILRATVYNRGGATRDLTNKVIVAGVRRGPTEDPFIAGVGDDPFGDDNNKVDIPFHRGFTKDELPGVSTWDLWEIDPDTSARVLLARLSRFEIVPAGYPVDGDLTPAGPTMRLIGVPADVDESDIGRAIIITGAAPTAIDVGDPRVIITALDGLVNGELFLDNAQGDTPAIHLDGPFPGNHFVMEAEPSQGTAADAPVPANVFVKIDAASIQGGIILRRLAVGDSPDLIVGVSRTATDVDSQGSSIYWSNTRGKPVAIRWDGVGTAPAAGDMLELSALTAGYVASPTNGTGEQIGSALSDESGGLVMIRNP